MQAAPPQLPVPPRLNPAELTQLRILGGVALEAVWGLLENSPLRALFPGEILLRQGEANHTLFMLLEGTLSVHLEDPTRPPVATLSPGVSVGELSVIDGSPASAYVRAQTACRLLCINEGTFWRLVQASHQFATNLLVLLAERMRATNRTAAATDDQRRHFEMAATSDALTGLKNRRWLDDTLPRLISREERDKRALSLAIVDVDFFKRFNDAFGHDAGDEVLRALGQLVSTRLRPLDLGARYGGEEFVVVFPGTTMAGAKIAAERLRQAVAGLAVTLAGGQRLPPVTISLGVAEARPGEAAESLLKRADTALYDAKRRGRNRVSTAE